MWIIGALLAAAPAQGQAAQGQAPACPKKFADAMPRVPLGNLIESSDYPSGAAREGRAGTVSFRLNVGVTGRVENVEILEATSPDFALATERVLRRKARFTPAVRNCQPVTGEFEGKLRWVPAE